MRITTLLLAALLLCLFACTSKESQKQEQAANAPQAQATPLDPSTAATVSGVVKFEGTPPKPQKIDMAQDPACGNQPNVDESYVINNGNLANAFVYVKSRERKGGLLVATSGLLPKIEQRGCRYHPHVLGIMLNQSVQILNADGTTHNIHPMPTQSKQWNESQLPKAEPIVKTFNKPEIMIPIKCNQHPWMKMYLNVVDNPWFAVTDENGTFDLKGLPPGEYTLTAVHEKLGEQTIEISVGPKESKTADFTFKAQ
jgi:plastocyanin